MTAACRALVLGIDDYPGSPLTGCVADAKGIAPFLQRHQDGSRNYDVRLVTGDSASIDRRDLRTFLAELFEHARDASILFFFTGHGVQTPCGAELVTQDCVSNSLGVSMNDVITLANDSPAREVTLILDCCFSGDVANVPGLQSAGVAEGFRLDRALLRENVTVLAASTARQPSAEIPGGGQGAVTLLLLEGLDGGAADHLGEVTALSLYAFASRAFGARSSSRMSLSRQRSESAGPRWTPNYCETLPHALRPRTRVSPWRPPMKAQGARLRKVHRAPQNKRRSTTSSSCAMPSY